MPPDPVNRRKIFLTVLLILVPILFFLGWSQASLNLSFIRPSSSGETIALLVLSTVIFLAFVIFALILLRILLKLYVERQEQQLGSRFKTKMVVAFLGLSLVPVIFLFIFAYGLLNRTIDRWFSAPLDLIRQDSQELVRQLKMQSAQRADHISIHLAQDEDMVEAMEKRQVPAVARLVMQEVTADPGSRAAMCFDVSGKLLAQAGDPWPDPAMIERYFPQIFAGTVPPNGLTGQWYAGQYEFFVSLNPIISKSGAQVGSVAGIMRLPSKLTQISSEIQQATQKYDELSKSRRAERRSYVSMLWLLTLLILFIATWFAMFFSKQVTVPIQALANATHEVAQGNLGFQISARADDELGVLIHSFNQMTQQLLENRRAIEQASLNLQEANRQLEERGNTIEAILENIPTGVISFDPQGQITRLNSTAERLFGRPRAQSARVIADLFSAEDARLITRMFRRAARQGVVTQQTELDVGGRRAFMALTVSSVQARHGRVGSVLVLEDLAEVLRSQRTAAWQEVARRIAHEIKNPLTPIQLSTERILRLLERPDAEQPDRLKAVGDSARLIGREVGTLKTLVDEFTEFARFPASKPAPSQINDILVDALNVFAGRLDGIVLQRELSPDLPMVQADPDQMKRVVVNLIDNAAEALDQSLRKEIWVRSTLAPDRDIVEIIIEDSGPGIPPEAKERLFLPYFSTKRSGTGLGLAIVNRIIAEHHGAIRVEENFPTGTKFVIELPVDHALVANTERALGPKEQVKNSVLIVDDEPGIRESLTNVLEDEGYLVESVESGEACLETLATNSFDAILLDIWLPGLDGIQVLEKIQSLEARPTVIMISGHGTIEAAVRSTKLGAFDFIEKPLSIEKTLLTLRHALEQARLAAQNRDLREELRGRDRIIGDSIPMKALRQQLQLAAPTHGRVLIYGESGTGKELVAHALHNHSQRADEAFVEVNCAAIPEELIESELFGHLKGSFTGALEDKTGKFEQAHGGSLFLDEVGDMSLRTQSKVLRVIEEQRFTPIGSGNNLTVDVRIVAATNKHLEDEIQKGNFREDLFYRLNVIPFYVPPLREHAEDIATLANFFLEEFARAYGRRPKHFAEAAMETLVSYRWPGNVRELKNLVERLVIMVPGERIERRHLPPALHQDGARSGPAAKFPTKGFSSLQEARTAYERDYILRTLEEHQGNVSRAAEVLGLERSHLYRKMKSLGIPVGS